MKCQIQDCDHKYYAKGYCNMHYLRSRLNGNPLISRRAPTHGQRQTPEYRAWRAMRYRCLVPTAHNYHYYGGRGITICDRWSEFPAFLADMGQRPGPEYSLDRKDNEGNYEPGNCRWATKSEQALNRRPATFVVQ